MRLDVRDLGFAPQGVFGQCQHHRPRTAAARHLIGTRDVFRNARGVVDLRDPLGHLAEHAAVIDFLEGFALDEVATDLTDEQDHRRGILIGGVHGDGGVGGARATGDEAHARLVGQLAVGFGHVACATFLAADDGLDGALVLIERIDARQVAFARHQEDTLGAVQTDLIDEDLPAIAQRQGGSGGSVRGLSHGSALVVVEKSVLRRR